MSNKNLRGWNPFTKALYLFLSSSLRPSRFKDPRVQGTIVGTDHLGNKYFEVKADPAKGKRNPIRYFKPPHEDDWDKPLPPEWNAWLRLLREEPPSEEEQARNIQRLENLAQKKALASPEQQQHQQPLFPKDSSFPKFPEYEEIPGTKYKQ